MCRNIKPLFNFEPPATDEEIHDAALQFVRKISGYRHPSQANQAIFETAVLEIAEASERLLNGLVTTAPAKDRATEVAKAKERSRRRFG